LHPWSCDTLIHHWSYIIIIILVLCIIIILVLCIIIILIKVEKGLEAVYGVIQIGALVEERNNRVGVLEEGQ